MIVSLGFALTLLLPTSSLLAPFVLISPNHRSAASRLVTGTLNNYEKNDTRSILAQSRQVWGMLALDWKQGWYWVRKNTLRREVLESAQIVMEIHFW